MDNKPFNAYNPVFCHLTRRHNNILAHYHTGYELYYTLDGSTRIFVVMKFLQQPQEALFLYLKECFIMLTVRKTQITSI